MQPIALSTNDKETLRRLAAEWAAIAALPVHREKAALWQRLNDRQPGGRPMVWINEIPWHEMDVDGELTLHCADPWAREQETRMRRTLYQWAHMPGDMIVPDHFPAPLIIRSTGFGIDEQVAIAQTDAANSVVSRHFTVQLASFADLEKIIMPVVTLDEEETARRFQAAEEAFGDILPVRPLGRAHIWYTPWDNLIRWTGIEEAMLMMYEDPDLVHALVDRVVQAYLSELDQLEALNLLALNDNATRIGSGGFGHTGALPGAHFDPARVRPGQMWGCSNAQIFSEVSPEFHWTFAVEHDLPWMRRWGLNYYGCCEPLDGKADVLARIPNLRKVSVSPWCKTERAVEQLGGRYVLSRKPNPAILAEDNWHPERARQELRQFLDAAGKTCHVELIMKDISTVRYQPQRLWEWARVAMEEAERVAT
ncbi:MAG: hypothetical protein K9N49_09420 [Candidatus Marinimicrobia bacterium]|nr:hypothetical protein [Candidatus Neomarinimicrobiota bacterium]